MFHECLPSEGVNAWITLIWLASSLPPNVSLICDIVPDTGTGVSKDSSLSKYGRKMTVPLR